MHTLVQCYAQLLIRCLHVPPLDLTTSNRPSPLELNLLVENIDILCRLQISLHQITPSRIGPPHRGSLDSLCGLMI